jgi:hypothetical protein
VITRADLITREFEDVGDLTKSKLNLSSFTRHFLGKVAFNQVAQCNTRKGHSFGVLDTKKGNLKKRNKGKREHKLLSWVLNKRAGIFWTQKQLVDYKNKEARITRVGKIRYVVKYVHGPQPLLSIRQKPLDILNPRYLQHFALRRER